MAFLNRSRQPRPVRLDWRATLIADKLTKAELNAAKTAYRLRDPWTRKAVGNTQKPFTTVPAHDVMVVVLSR